MRSGKDCSAELVQSVRHISQGGEIFISVGGAFKHIIQTVDQLLEVLNRSENNRSY